MYLSSCLKIQIDDKEPEVISFRDFLVSDVLDGYSSETIALLGVLTKHFVSISPYVFQNHLPPQPMPKIFIGSWLDYYEPSNGFSFINFGFEHMKGAITQFVTRKDGFNTFELKYQIQAATRDTLQSILDSMANETININLEPSIIKYMPCSTTELANLNSVSDLNAQYVDVYPYLVNYLENTDLTLESEGFVRAAHKLIDDYILCSTDCSFSITTTLN